MYRTKMKLVCVLLTGIIFIGYAQAKESEELPLINVSGTAEIKVVPDRIHLSVQIEVIQKELDEAKSISDSRFKACRDFIRQQGVNDKDIQADFISIYPSYDDRYSKIKADVFRVQRSLEIVIRDTAKYDDILSGLLKNGVNNVQVSFRTSELRKYRDEARILAARAAKEKAELIAKELGVKVGKAYKINESYSGGLYYSNYGKAQNQNVAQSAAPDQNTQENDVVSVGMISVSATVNVSFLIE